MAQRDVSFFLVDTSGQVRSLNCFPLLPFCLPQASLLAVRWPFHLVEVCFGCQLRLPRISLFYFRPPLNFGTRIFGLLLVFHLLRACE